MPSMTPGDVTVQPSARLPVGTPVEVRDHFCARWSRGFEIAASRGDRYTVRRLSDGYVLPAEFADDDVARVR